jgi:chemotaxis protein MotB
VVRVFREVGVPGERLAAVSRGEFAPVASNETEEERALNRRIEILLLPDAPGSPRPTAESAAPPP